MQNRRLLFSVIIKLLIFSGLLLLIFVFVNSLFTEDTSTTKVTNAETSSAIIKITEMTSGQIKKVRWDGHEVAILLRQFPDKLKKADTKEQLHPSINLQMRSKKSEYFVYFNFGDSKNCPLYYAAGVFKDVCSLNRFDEAGRDVKGNLQSYMLEIPPHYFDKGNVVFGQWKAQ